MFLKAKNIALKMLKNMGYNILGEKRWGDNYGTKTVQKLRKMEKQKYYKIEAL